MHQPTTNTLPRVSVIMATYNRADVLQKCLSYYAGQTYPNIEILVAINGSTDNTVEMLRLNYPDVKIAEFKKGIGPLALNTLADLATGEYLWRTDDDAYPEKPDTLEMAVKFMQENPTVVALSGEILERIIGYKTVNYYPFRKEYPVDLPEGLPLKEFCGAAAMIRREQFIQCGGFWDQFYFEELDLSIRLLLLPNVPRWEMRYTPWIKIVHENAFFGKGNQSKRWKLQLSQSIRIQWKYYPVIFAIGRTAVVSAFMLVSGLSHRVAFSEIASGFWSSLKTAAYTWKYERIKVKYSDLRRATSTRSTIRVHLSYFLQRIKQRRQYV
ncbi:MAG: glycosyltransferase family 2 protein [Ignavibacteria bacterium]|nr:glycosyltransferase family 2 protein [Ignavibacteria bacterium]